MLSYGRLQAGFLAAVLLATALLATALLATALLATAPGCCCCVPLGSGSAGKRVPADPLPQPLQPVANPNATIPLPKDDRNLHVGQAAYRGIRRTHLQIYRVSDGKSVCTLPAYCSADSRRGTTDFISPNRFLAVHTAPGQGVQVRVWNVTDGKELGSFEAKGLSVQRQLAVSPGGRYLATHEQIGPDRGAHVFELPTGIPVRKLMPAVFAGASLTSQGMAFSHDGKEFCTIGTSFEKNIDFLQTWNFETGKRTGFHVFKTRLEKTAVNARFYPVPVTWLPDRSGVLAYGQLLIGQARRTGHNGGGGAVVTAVEVATGA